MPPPQFTSAVRIRTGLANAATSAPALLQELGERVGDTRISGQDQTPPILIVNWLTDGGRRVLLRCRRGELGTLKAARGEVQYARANVPFRPRGKWWINEPKAVDLIAVNDRLYYEDTIRAGA